MKCTMPKCRGSINGVTGLDELMKLRRHFERAHKVALTTGDALSVRLDIENGIAPNLLRAMLGTDEIKPADLRGEGGACVNPHQHIPNGLDERRKGFTRRAVTYAKVKRLCSRRESLERNGWHSTKNCMDYRGDPMTPYPYDYYDFARPEPPLDPPTEDPICPRCRETEDDDADEDCGFCKGDGFVSPAKAMRHFKEYLEDA